jgi:putative ABC transport system ATP-binding protein
MSGIVTTAGVVRGSGISFWFGHGDLRRQILFDVDIDIQPGEVVLLTGPSGSGKTTLLTLIAGLRTMQQGQLDVLGHALAGAEQNDLIALRQKIGFIFQAHNLLPWLTSLQNVQLMLDLQPQVSPREGRERAVDMLRQVGLGDKLQHRISQLSGGQRQRVAVARALVGNPQLVLADEPTAALDSVSGREVVTLLQQLARRQNRPVLMVTHDPRVLDIADRIMEMQDGRLSQRVLATA